MRATQPRIRFSRVRSLSFSTALELQLPRCSTALSGSRLGLHRLGGSIASYVPLSGPEGFFFFFPSNLAILRGILGIKILNFEFVPRLPWVLFLTFLA